MERHFLLLPLVLLLSLTGFSNVTAKSSAGLRDPKEVQGADPVADRKTTVVASQQSGQAEMVIKAFLKSASGEQKKKNYPGAMKFYMDAYDHCLTALRNEPAASGLNDLLGNITGSIAVLSSKTGRMRSDIPVFEKQLKAPGPVSETHAMYLYGLLSELYRNAGSFDTAVEYALLGMQKAGSTGNSLYTARMKGSLAVSFYKLGKYNEALSQALSAEVIMVSLNNTEYLAALYNNIASIYQKNYNLPKASLYFIKSLRIKEKMKDSVGVAFTLNNLGVVYESWGDTMKALQYFHQALWMNKSLQIKPNLSYTYNNLGTIYLDLKVPDSALFYFGKALELKRELNDVYGVVMILESLGQTYQKLLNNPDAALEKYGDASQIAGAIGAGYWQAILDIDVGEIFIDRGRYDEARELLEQALTYAKQEKQFDMVQSAAKFLILADATESNNSRIRKRFLEYLSASDSVTGREKSDLTAELLARFETEKKDKENLILKKDNDIKNLNISRKNLQLTALAVLVFLLAISGAVTYFLYRKRDQAYRMIVRKNLEIVRAEAILRERGDVIAGEKPETSLADDPAQQGKAEDDDSEGALLGRLYDCFTREKPYLDPELSLEDICRMINTNRTYLSGIINDHLSKNFPTFLNEFRVAEARRLLAEKKFSNYTIEEIGKMAGFKSTTTFHHHFKYQIGVTPAYFRSYSGNEI